MPIEQAPNDYLGLIKTSLDKMRATAVGSLRLYLDSRRVFWLVDSDGIPRPTSPGNRYEKAGEDLFDGAAVYKSPADSKWYLINLNATPVGISRVFGIVNNGSMITKNATGLICINGTVESTISLIPGAPIYASTVPGGITQVEPTATLGGLMAVKVMIGDASDDGTKIGVIDSGGREVIYQQRFSAWTAAGTKQMTHHADANTPTRTVTAYSSTDATSTIASYPFTSQDATLAIQSPLSNALAQPFTVTNATTLSKIRVMLSKTGIGTDTISCAIYGRDVLGYPSGLIGTSSTTISTTAMSANLATFEFSFSNLALNANTPYFIVLSSGGLLTLGQVNVGADTSNVPASPGNVLRQTAALVWITALLVPSTITFEALSAQGTKLVDFIVVGAGSAGVGWTATSQTVTTLTNLAATTRADTQVSIAVK